MRFLGFKTFGHIIDERYDDIEDHAERLFAVTQAIDEFLRISIDDLHRLYVENIDIIDHNRKLIANIVINQIVTESLIKAKSIR